MTSSGGNGGEAGTYGAFFVNNRTFTINGANNTISGNGDLGVQGGSTLTFGTALATDALVVSTRIKNVSGAGAINKTGAGTVVFSFGELVFSSAVPAAVARLAPAGRRGAYQGGWTLIASFSMGSALFVSGLLREAIGWPGAWLVFASLIAAAALLLLVFRRQFVDAPRER